MEESDLRDGKEDKILRVSREPLDRAMPEAITLDVFVIGGSRF